ncbi:MAG: DHH family phosphoesterase [Haliea sp.]|uniref:DHH family phosphoesterase n=1 Tax=Haliea sp. TaxID=1932666 RepID=UPI0032EFFFD8
MQHYDVFNGDADGICALVQLRRAQPRDAVLVTGVKRDISLLRQVKAGQGSQVTVLDVSLDKNRSDLERLLEAGADVFYCDHHFAGEIPRDARLKTLINPAPDVCTSLLVNGHLHGAFPAWAAAGAFGDNLRDSALRLARPLGLGETQLLQLEQLGIYINYNGYGPSLEDLHFAPADLYRLLSQFDDPFAFMAEGRAHFERLETGYREDMAAAAALAPEYRDAAAAVYLLPDAAWARRVSGVFGNDLANSDPVRAHAVVTLRQDGNYLVSVRAPLNNKSGADVLCREFPTGGGRAAAAGINELPANQLPQFIARIAAFYA